MTPPTGATHIRPESSLVSEPFTCCSWVVLLGLPIASPVAPSSNKGNFRHDRATSDTQYLGAPLRYQALRSITFSGLSSTHHNIKNRES